MACLRADKEANRDKQPSASTPDQPSIVQIYTDWANHYLEKAKFRRFIQDLQIDLADGVLLADVIEAVTSEKVKDITRKPKNVTQMIDNINACLLSLSGLGVNVEGLTARDIRDGNLKAILGLFFSISRFKQQQKQATGGAAAPSSGNNASHNTSSTMSSHGAASPANHGPASGIRAPTTNTTTTAGNEMQSRLPSPFRHSGRFSTVTVKEPGSNIPTPASSTLRKGTPDRTRLSTGPGGANIPQPQGLPPPKDESRSHCTPKLFVCV